MRLILVLVLLLSVVPLSACTSGPTTAEQERESEAWFEGPGSD